MGVPGGRVTFDDVFADNYRSIHRYLQRRLGADLADDLAAETFAIAFARWRRFDPARPVRPWLFGIAANLLRLHYRSESRKLRAYARTGVDPVVEEGESETLGRVTAQGRGRALAAALAELRREDREVLLLHAWAELSDEEIATALELPLGTVKSRLSRTRAQLRNRVPDFGEKQGERPAEERST